MKITYLDHSGFVVELPTATLVFDYYRDPSHALHKILEHRSELPVIFFVSHRHPDHYNPGIYELAQNCKRTYVVSNDVPAKEIPSTLAVQGMSPGDYVESLPGGIAVRAYGSTDSGVSFLVTTADGKKIFHAGDLNNWHWSDDSTPREVAKAEDHFRVIINRIAADTPAIDVAMFPVDTRMGTDFARGARQFLQTVKVANFLPMHFGNKYDEACDFAQYGNPASTTFHCLHRPGQFVTI